MDAGAARAWLLAAAAAVEEAAEQLTELDAAIGDGDHGANLRRGFRAVAAALDGAELPSPGAVLAKAGMTLISSVGGASGPLYGSAFRAMGKSLNPPGADPADTPADAERLAAAFTAGLEAVRRLGAAQPGDKTMVDAWAPAAAAFGAAADQGPAVAAAAAAEAAAAGALATVPLQARKGRASYLGERSIGHQDPGATSTALLFRTLAEVLAKG
ncbi:dihydroxyacetone kinase subunit L [Streptacidiphilus sp. P02-A3a]|nr:dihydroxyacetone kinase subunit L [Streptacidiphilus sp. P02-A3a]